MNIQWWLISNGIVVLLLFPVVWLACLAFRCRPACQHWLWLVLLIKLVLPPVFDWPLECLESAAAVAIDDADARVARSSEQLLAPVAVESSSP